MNTHTHTYVQRERERGESESQVTPWILFIIVNALKPCPGNAVEVVYGTRSNTHTQQSLSRLEQKTELN